MIKCKFIFVKYIEIIKCITLGYENGNLTFVSTFAFTKIVEKTQTFFCLCFFTWLIFEIGQFIFDFFILSTKIANLSLVFVIYRLFDKTRHHSSTTPITQKRTCPHWQVRNSKGKPPSYVLVETVGIEPTSRHNGT